MKRRCTALKAKHYKDYGGRGITVCAEWLDDFNAFWCDMGPTWEEGLTLDRENNDGNYEPSNCRWASYQIQANNRRMFSNNKTGVTGVYVKNNGKYGASVTINRQRYYLGTFNDVDEASKAIDKRKMEGMKEFEQYNTHG